jgi:DNA-binding response OmpR family regulator
MPLMAHERTRGFSKGGIKIRAPLAGCRILIAEDEWFLASDLQAVLKAVGADVVALVGDLDDAQAQVARGGFDVGIIDITLRGRQAFGLADELQRQGIPFIFFTGYGAEIIPARFADVARIEKPFDLRTLSRYVLQLWQRGTEAKPDSQSS